MMLLPVGPGAEGQQDQGVTQRAFFEPVEVPLVNVEVFVSDRSGQPLAGLGTGDFQILEDGHPVEISHFYAAQGVRLGGVAPETVEALEAPGDAPAPISEDPTYLVLFVDDTNMSTNRRAAVLEHLGGFFSTDLPEQLQVMVVSYDGEIHIRQSFTDHPEDVLPVLAEMRQETPLSYRAEEDQLAREMQISARGVADPEIKKADGEQYASRIDSYSRQVRELTRIGLEAMRRLVRSLSGLPGRTAVLWVSDGFESRVGQRLYSLWNQAYPEAASGSTALIRANQNNVTTDIRELVQFANAHRVSFYTMSHLGTQSLAAVSAETAGIGSAGADLFGLPSEEEAINLIAGGTGGRPLANNPNLGNQLAEVAVELGSYYSLGYEPRHFGDGRYHKIEVKVLRDGVKVRHREGYNDRSADDRAMDRTLAAAVLGVTENPMLVAAECHGQKLRDDGAFVVSIIVRVPLGSLVLVPGEAEHEGQISIQLAARDHQGGLSDVQRREYPVRVSNDQLMDAVSQQAGFVMGLVMREGPHTVAVGVRDAVANEESTLVLNLDVGAESEAAQLDG